MAVRGRSRPARPRIWAFSIRLRTIAAPFNQGCRKRRSQILVKALRHLGVRKFARCVRSALRSEQFSQF